MVQIDEPIMESAPLARWIAERLCRTNPATGESCSWYHGFWQYLRVLDLVTTPVHHADFYRDAFARCVPAGSRVRALISGAIDYSTLAHVLQACAAVRATADVTVVDVCDTPLFLNRWYAGRVDTRISTFRTDIVDFDAPASYDVVCTHSFFGQISPARRPGLMAKWMGMLKPGGHVITVNRIRRHTGMGQAGFSAEQARALRDAVLRKGAALKERLQITQGELERYADAYANRRRPHPVSSREEFAGLFQQPGFSVEYLSCEAVATAGGEQLSGPTTPGGAEYACIVARRP